MKCNIFEYCILPDPRNVGTNTENEIVNERDHENVTEKHVFVNGTETGIGTAESPIAVIGVGDEITEAAAETERGIEIEAGIVTVTEIDIAIGKILL